ncbi:MAG: hypothetical protein ABW276_01135 [Casimicrobiaceae bacterium]
MPRAVGWLEATACVFSIGAVSLVYAIGHALGAHPIAFILYAMIATAAVTLALVGFGPQAAAIVRHPMSWVVGLSIILLEVFYFQTIAYVAPAHGNIVLRIGIPLSMAAGWVFLRRRPLPLAIGGGVVIVLVIAFVVAVTPSDVRWPMAIAGTLAGTFMVLRGFASEFHPMNRTASTVREKLRFTGVVVLVASALSLALAAAAAVAVANGVLPETRMLPTTAQMLHAPTIILGCVVGGAALALMFYFNFSSVIAIGTESLMAMMAFSPATTWIFQEAGVALGWIDVRRPDADIVAAIVVCIAAVLLIFWADVRARRALALRHLPSTDRIPLS